MTDNHESNHREYGETAPSLTTPRAGRDVQPEESGGRPYLCIHFECCNVYARVYRPSDRPWYDARCPRCLRTTRINVSPAGSAARFFRAR